MARMYAVQLAFAKTGRHPRLELRPAHRERLAALAAEGRLLAAGPWADDSGALLVFPSTLASDLDAILAAGPLLQAPGVTVAGVQRVEPGHPAPRSRGALTAWGRRTSVVGLRMTAATVGT